MLNVLNYGVKPNGSDCYSIVQSLLDSGEDLYFPQGQYRVSAPLIMKNLNRSQQIIGAGSGSIPSTAPTDYNAQTLIYNISTQMPIIIINVGQGVMIKDVGLAGLNYSPYLVNEPTPNLSSYLATGARTNRYSPHCAIAIDPFANTVSVAPTDMYSGLSSNYPTGSGTQDFVGSQDIIFDNVSIAGFVVGVTHNSIGSDLGQGQITYNNCKFSYCDTGISIGNKNIKSIQINNTSFKYSRQAIDGYMYGDQNGASPTLNNCYFKDLYRIFSIPNTNNTLSLDNCVAENIQTLGSYGSAASIKQAPLNIKGGTYSTEKDPVWVSLSYNPPHILESYSPTKFVGTTFINYSNNVVNVVGSSNTCFSFDNCSFENDSSTNTSIIINSSEQSMSGYSLFNNCKWYKKNGSIVETLDDNGSNQNVPNRFLITPKQQTIGNYNVVRGSGERYGVSTTSGFVFGPSNFTFNCTGYVNLVVGDILMWRTLAQSPSTIQHMIPSFKITNISGSSITCSYLYSKDCYDQTYAPSSIFVVMEQWAINPAINFTADTNTNTTLSNIQPGVLRPGDWIYGSSLDTATRVVSTSGTTATLNKSTLSTKAEVDIYFGICYPKSTNTSTINMEFDFTYQRSYNNKLITNSGASSLVNYTVWSPIKYDKFMVRRISNFPIRIYPPAGVSIGEGGPGKYVEIQSYGKIELICEATGKWEINDGGTLISYQV